MLSSKSINSGCHSNAKYDQSLTVYCSLQHLTFEPYKKVSSLHITNKTIHSLSVKRRYGISVVLLKPFQCSIFVRTALSTYVILLFCGIRRWYSPGLIGVIHYYELPSFGDIIFLIIINWSFNPLQYIAVSVEVEYRHNITIHHEVKPYLKKTYVKYRSQKPNFGYLSNILYH